MSSNIARGRHLDATTGREVVYCWGCQNEWYRDEQEGLECPRCYSEITEIVSPGENDPRGPEIGGSAIFGGHPHDHGSDSDPEEDDIEQHLQEFPHGFFMRRTNLNPDGPRDGTSGPASPSPNANVPEDDVLRNFTDMIFNLQGGRPNQPDQGQGQGHGQEGRAPGHGSHDVHVAGAHRIQSRTWTAGPFGVTTFSFVAGGPVPPANNGGHEGPASFDAMFANMLGQGMHPNPHGLNAPADGQPRHQGPIPIPGFAGGLGGFLAALLNPAGAIHGDAVYSQEALDRIITQLMEANPQSNAAPPASQEAISRLQTRKLVDKDLDADGKAECTICIDDVHKDDEVTVLPCKHWFHAECVTLWLKEHNTCPVCRAPIEGDNNTNTDTNTNTINNDSNSTGGRQQQQQQQQQQQPEPSISQDASPLGYRSPQAARERYGNYRTRMDNEERLQAIRNLAGGSYHSSQPSQPASTSMQGYQQRRSSMSPPPDHSLPREFRSRSRDRDGGSDNGQQRFQMMHPPPVSGYDQAPSEAGVDQNRDGDHQSANSTREGGNTHNNNPLAWLRGQFSRHSSSGSGGGGGGSGGRS